MNYNEIRKDLKTFDIINCEGKGWLWKAVGHTAGIYHNGDIDEVNVFESTQRGNFGKSGVQLNTASEWFKRYEGRVWVRRFTVDKITDMSGHYRRSNEFIALTRGLPYPNIRKISGLSKLILSSLDLHTPSGKDLLTYKGKDSGIFCTMLVAAWYIYSGLTRFDYESRTIGLFNRNRLKWALWVAQEFEPDDMREGGKFEKVLRDGVSLGQEVEVSK